MTKKEKFLEKYLFNIMVCTNDWTTGVAINNETEDAFRQRIKADGFVVYSNFFEFRDNRDKKICVIYTNDQDQTRVWIKMEAM